MSDNIAGPLILVGCLLGPLAFLLALEGLFDWCERRFNLDDQREDA